VLEADAFAFEAGSAAADVYESADTLLMHDVNNIEQGVLKVAGCEFVLRSRRRPDRRQDRSCTSDGFGDGISIKVIAFQHMKAVRKIAKLVWCPSERPNVDILVYRRLYNSHTEQPCGTEQSNSHLSAFVVREFFYCRASLVSLDFRLYFSTEPRPPTAKPEAKPAESSYNVPSSAVISPPTPTLHGCRTKSSLRSSLATSSPTNPSTTNR